MKQQYDGEFRKSDRPFFRALGIGCAIAISVVSCVTPKKACKTLDAHPKERAEFCADRYKPVEKTVTKTKYLPGKKILTHDTSFVTVDCDSVLEANRRKIVPIKSIVRVPVPTYLQVDTAAIESVIERENVAALAAKDSTIDFWKRHYTTDINKVQSKNDLLTSAYEKSHKSAIKGWSAFTILSLLLLGYTVARVWLKSKANAVKNLIS